MLVMEYGTSVSLDGTGELKNMYVGWVIEMRKVKERAFVDSGHVCDNIYDTYFGFVWLV